MPAKFQTAPQMRKTSKQTAAHTNPGYVEPLPVLSLFPRSYQVAWSTAEALRRTKHGARQAQRGKNSWNLLEVPLKARRTRRQEPLGNQLLLIGQSQASWPWESNFYAERSLRCENRKYEASDFQRPRLNCMAQVERHELAITSQESCQSWCRNSRPDVKTVTD